MTLGKATGMVFCFSDQSQRKKYLHTLKNVTDLIKTKKAEVPGTHRNGEEEEKFKRLAAMSYETIFQRDPGKQTLFLRLYGNTCFLVQVFLYKWGGGRGRIIQY